ncbi:MAG: transcription antitermination factor NusB [Candidatus Eremiobacteraeota bacterium]|nr:transcription antitermination factor NusB [Candidatus Eremiobacteraeota bacterium]NNM92542.1 transcription antitermination factor NusB [Candidatus Eremiobacteraeota bacterium]
MLRERALQALYAIEVGGRDPAEALEEILGSGGASDDRAFVRELVLGTLAGASDADQRIGPALQGWTLDRLAIVDRTILRLAVCEAAQIDAPPRAVIMNEAVELAKRYSTPEAARFVNGVLSGVFGDASSAPT